MSEALLLKDNDIQQGENEPEIKDSELNKVIVTDSDLQEMQRTRRLKEIQNQIDKGEYNIPAEDIAGSILNQD